MVTRVFIELTSYGQAGARYRVTTEAGRVLVASSRTPALDAARALLAEGVTGRLQVWRPSGTSPAMNVDIERAATLTVLEGDRQGPRFGAWKPSTYNFEAEAGTPDRAGMALEAHTSRQRQRLQVQR
jgi:hypothetical protein